MLHSTLDHIRYCHETSVWMIREPGYVIIRIFGTEVIKHEKGIKMLDWWNTDSSPDFYTRTVLHGGGLDLIGYFPVHAVLPVCLVALPGALDLWSIRVLRKVTLFTDQSTDSGT